MIGLSLLGCSGKAPEQSGPADASATRDLLVCGRSYCCSDEDCRDSFFPGATCNLRVHSCLDKYECLPGGDWCDPAHDCWKVNGVFRCVARCRADADCAPAQRCCSGHCFVPAIDVNNCGACGAACPPVANGQPGCSAGSCVAAGCNPGFDDCDRDPGNGCEVETNRDPHDCGACRKECVPFANGVATCTLGQCGAICAPGFSDCNSDTRDGCEVAVNTDAMNCGGCGKRCPQGMSCDGGRCR